MRKKNQIGRMLVPDWQPELKTEEGYSADIVRTYIYPWRYMSAQCQHYVHTTSHERYMSAQCDILAGCRTPRAGKYKELSCNAATNIHWPGPPPVSPNRGGGNQKSSSTQPLAHLKLSNPLKAFHLTIDPSGLQGRTACTRPFPTSVSSISIDE